MAFTLALMAVEIGGGWWSGSLALWADAGHMASDAGALGLALGAQLLASRPPSRGASYGALRAEVLAALANGLALVALAGWLSWEAWLRWQAPTAVDAPWMLGVGLLGLVANLGSLWALHDHRSESLNLRGAWWHVLTDALGSVAVILAAGLLWAWGWAWADPLATWAIALLALSSGLAVCRAALAVLMEWAPTGLGVGALAAELEAMPGLGRLLDLHVWSIVDGLVAGTVRLVAAPGASAEALRVQVHEALAGRVDHLTVEVIPAEAWADGAA